MLLLPIGARGSGKTFMNFYKSEDKSDENDVDYKIYKTILQII